MKQIYITLGRWTGPTSSTSVPSLDEEDIQKAIDAHLAGIKTPELLATQVLVWWDNQGVHDLYAIYTIKEKRLLLAV